MLRKNCILSVLLFCCLFFFGCHTEKKKIKIAVVGPFSEEKENMQATSIRRGIALALENLEDNRIIPQNKYEFDFISDYGDPIKAAAVAEKIGKGKEYVAVIGHLYSAPTLAAAPVYKKYHIPAITLGATNNAVTQNNAWYFRTIFNDKLQGEYLANYVYDILKSRHVAVIKEDEPYGNYLGKVFSKTITQLGGSVDFVKTIAADDPHSVTDTVRDLRKSKYAAPLFLAVHPDIGINLVRALKDYGINCKLVGPDALATDQFVQGFKDDIKEKENPGFYAKDIVVSSPFILDIAGNDAQTFNSVYQQIYNQKEDWTAALAYDTAQLLLTGLNNITNTDKKDSVSICRVKLKDYLSGINTKSKSFNGITGHIYFNANGDSQRPVAIGIYRGKNNIISALKQYSEIVVNSENENFLEKEKDEGHIININGKNMYRTNIVYVGSQVNSMTDLALDKMHCKLDFYIWFRCQGNFSIENISFINAENPKELVIKKIESTDENMIDYNLYRVKGFFKLDYGESVQKFHEHTAGFSLRNTKQNRNNLIFVPDFLGGSMEISNMSVEESHQFLNPEYLMVIKDINAYQDVLKQPMYGHPDYLSTPEAMVDFSCFNFNITIKKNELSDAFSIPEEIQKRLLVVTTLVMIISFILVHLKSMEPYLRILWFLQFFSTMIFIFCSRTFFLDAVIGIIGMSVSEMFDTVYNIMFLMVPAYFIVRFLHYFIWEPLQKRSGQNIPDLFKKITAFIIYLLAIFGVLALVFHKQVNSLLATSGFIAMVFGYAVRMNLSNIFSGIVVNTERSFRIGDSVRIGSKYEGKIVDMNWRTVCMINKENNIVSIPNHLVADMDIVNLNRPKGSLSIAVKVQIKNCFAPERVKKILFDAVYSTNCIQLEPKPEVVVVAIDGENADFWISFYVKNYQKESAARESLLKRLWIHLYAAGMQPARNEPDSEIQSSFISENPRILIDVIDVFKSLTKEEKNYFVEDLKIEKYKKDFPIILQGDTGKEIFIIAEGVVLIQCRTKENKLLTLERLGVGEIVGEAALLTGHLRNASVIAFTDVTVFHISEDAINTSLQNNKLFNEHLQYLSSEHSENSMAQIKKEEQKKMIKPKTLSEKLKNTIKLLKKTRNI